MDLGLQGRVALVTGASAGIGRGIAAELVREGARVAISSRSRERIEATAAEVGATGFVFDSDDVEGAGRLLREVEARLGSPVEVLVISTGGPPGGDPLSFGREQWEGAYRSLVLTPMALVERAVPGMRRRGWGRILSVSSSAVREPLPHLMLSNTHRAALLAGFKTIARDVAADGVTLNTVLPGRIATDRIFSMYGSREAAEADASSLPAGRLGTVEEMAAAAVFLCSARASYVTGQALAIDGGMLHAV